MQIKALSWSEYWLYNNRPDDWYKEYVLGIKSEPSREMILGSITHSAFEGKEWKKELKDKFFTANYERTIQKLLDGVKIPECTKEVWLGNYRQIYEETNCAMTGRADGVNIRQNLIIEIKTGKGLWNERRANEHEQLTWYSFLYWKQHGNYPLHQLISMNIETGKHIVIEIKKTEEQIKILCQDIKRVVDEMWKKDLFNKRTSTYVATKI